MSEDIEGRENETELGALPEDLLSERQEQASDGQDPEFIPPGTLIQGRTAQGIPMDIEREGRVSAKDGEIGSVSMPFGVTSTYDARPINARDFLTTIRGSFTVDLGDPNSSRVTVTRTIPGGYIGVLRGFSVEPNFVTGLSTSFRESSDVFDDYRYSLLLDGVVVPGYEDMELGAVVNAYDLPTWVLGLEQQTFGLRIVYQIDAAITAVGNGNDMYFNVSFYGNELLTRGVPLAFQIASQNETGGSGR